MDKYQDFLSRLSEIERKVAPKELFYEGDFSLLTDTVKVSVVGSRKLTEFGYRRTETIVKALVDRDITVVSGLAEGIDTAAHRTAIEQGGKTITVLGTALDQCYPASNRDLLNEIKRGHLAISQFSAGARVFQSNFPTRNKTMALISDATIIVEASEKSGTRHQAWEAIKLGKQVFIMSNVFKTAPEWTKKVLEYGAEELKKDNFDFIIEGIAELSVKQIDYSWL